MPETRIFARRDIFGKPAAHEFVGREKELAFLRGAADLLRKGIPSCIVVSGLPGMGKTEILRQAADECLEMEGGPLPVYLSTATGSVDPWADLEGQLRRVIVSVVRGSVSDTLSMVLNEFAGGADSRAEALGKATLPEGDHRGKAERLAETVAAAAEELGTKLMIFLDDADLLGMTTLPTLLASVAARAGRVPVSWVLAAAWTNDQTGGVEPLVRRLPLGPIPEREAGNLLAFFMARSGVVFHRDCLRAASLLGGIPGLIREVAVSASLSGIISFDHPEAFVRFYVDELSSGFLHQYHRVLLGAMADSGQTTLELLLFLMGRSGGHRHAGTAAREKLKEREGLASAIINLVRLGIIENRWGKMAADIPATVADFCRLESRRFLEGCSMEEAKARLFVEKMAVLSREPIVSRAVRNTEELTDFLRSWRGQPIPKVLMEWERFREVVRTEGSPTPEKLAAADKSRLILPRIVNAWPERFSGNDKVPSYSLDLLALAFAEKDGGERWLAIEIRLGEREVTSAMVADFVHRCRSFQDRTALAAGMLKGWVISGGGFSAEAVESLRKLNFWSSGPEQLRLMAAVTGWTRAMELAFPAADVPEEPHVFELVIPAVADTELVAARALEQMGQGLPLAEGEIGKIKMALVEACINAFEHGASEEKKIHLTFKVGRSSLEIEVFNRGRSFVPGKIIKPAIEDKMTSVNKRGWGLSLIKELMDDMEFIQREDGTLLRMVKYFKRESGE